ncbi:MAG TPA: hypothetical protein VN682_17055 [Terriglobales bacterium]|nr:hypothetical protein [Terriglobales bacterium]
MTAIDNARTYAWGDWWIGIMRSFLSGGAAAFLTGTGGALVGVPSGQVWKLMGINFVLMGLYRMGEFLTLHGAPDKVQENLNVAEGKAKEAVAAVQEAQKAATPIDKQ